MLSNPRHGSPPRLMAHQPTRFPTTQESSIRVYRPDPVSVAVIAVSGRRIGIGRGYRTCDGSPDQSPSHTGRNGRARVAAVSAIVAMTRIGVRTVVAVAR